ncbi:hypothetical protein NEOLEDRAFT_1244188 [Neolentinus lepideus HHB14362 ss-1]|uniref:F-box domain-containing protein n=1 Tax=Neolentinus lepideus HHB14362 ss-1 TaxID=1314782 RepID=A0A165Q7L9_9AGAM|nr:hypothetical protein NEOLEDRAFT_1244188 [Neolentinus lepideus HHB14362 ss-1]
MIDRLPLDVQIEIFQSLAIDDVLRLRLVSKNLYSSTEIRSLWFSAVTKALEVVPIPQVFKKLSAMPTATLQFEAIRHSMLERSWHRENLAPMSLREIPSFHDVQYLELLPGGDWLVTIAGDGSVCLQHVSEPRPRIVKRGIDAYLHKMTSAISYSSGFDSLLLITGTNGTDETSHLFLYCIDTQIPRMESVLTLKLSTNVLAASAAFGILAVGTGQGEAELIHIISVDEYSGQQRSIVLMDVRSTGSMEESTLTILSRSQVFLCCSYGFALYDIPQVEQARVGNSQDPPTIMVTPTWSLKHELTLSLPVSSHVVWQHMALQQPGTIFILDYHELHVLNLTVSPVSHIEVSLPVKVGGDLTALGTHRGVWWNRYQSAQNDARSLRLWTCTLPRIPAHEEDLIEDDFPIAAGSLIVPCKDKEEVEYLSLDEWSGRVCLLFERKESRGRIVLVDVCQ